MNYTGNGITQGTEGFEAMKLDIFITYQWDKMLFSKRNGSRLEQSEIT